MTETKSSNIPQPVRPRSGQKYDLLRETAAVAAATSQSTGAAAADSSTRQHLFTMHITATSEKGAPMDNEQKFLIDLIFKPDEPGLKLRPEETQLLLAYFSEILKEIEEEEKVINEEAYARK